MSSLLDAFINELGIRGPVPLVGHALGASVAVAYAREHPDQVDRIMAISLPLGLDSVNQRLVSGGGVVCQPRDRSRAGRKL